MLRYAITPKIASAPTKRSERKCFMLYRGSTGLGCVAATARQRWDVVKSCSEPNAGIAKCRRVHFYRLINPAAGVCSPCGIVSGKGCHRLALQ